MRIALLLVLLSGCTFTAYKNARERRIGTIRTHVAWEWDCPVLELQQESKEVYRVEGCDKAALFECALVNRKCVVEQVSELE